MAIVKFTDAQIFWGGVNASAKHNSIDLNYSAAMLDGTTFGQGTTVNFSGLLQWSMSGSGFWDAAASNNVPDPNYFTNTGAAAGVPLSLAPANSDGGVAYIFNTIGSNYTFFGTIGELTPFSIDMAPTKYGTKGVIALQPSSRAASANGTSMNLGTITSAQKLVAAVHVTAFSGTSLDVVIQSDDDTGFPSATSRIAFTQATGITSEWKELAGPITPDNFFRASCTFVGTSFTALVVVGVASYT